MLMIFLVYLGLVGIEFGMHFRVGSGLGLGNIISWASLIFMVIAIIFFIPLLRKYSKIYRILCWPLK